MTLAMTAPRLPQRSEFDAFEALVRAQTPRLWPIACALTGERAAAAQVLKASFAALEPRFGSMAGPRLVTWLRRRVISSGLGLVHESSFRHTKPIQMLLPRFDAEGRHECRTNPNSPPADRATVERNYRDGLRRLPRAHRDAVLLLDVLKLDRREAAALLDLTPKEVGRRLHEGRLALREHLVALRAS